MHNRSWIATALMAVSVFVGLTGMATAQQTRPPGNVPQAAPSAAPAPVPSPVAQPAATPQGAAIQSTPTEPQVTTATFGDWLLRCVRPTETGVRPICELSLSIQAQGQQGLLAQFAIGRPAQGGPLRLAVALVHNLSFATAPRLVTGGSDGVTVDLVWRRCLPQACFADAALTPATLQHMRGRTEAGRLVFQDGADREANVSFSFRGLAQALDALAREVP